MDNLTPGDTVDTAASKTSGRLKVMLGKRHAKKAAKGKAKGRFPYFGKGGPVEDKAKFSNLNESQTFKKSDALGVKQ